MTVARILALGVCLVGLLGCSATDDAADGRSSTLGGLFADTGARKPRADAARGKPGALVSVENSATAYAATDVAGPAAPGIKRVAYVGVQEVPETEAAASGGSYRLNFENAELKDVVQAVLGEALKINYTMGEDVVGKVTISSPRPLTETELLSALESVLQGNGFAMTRSASGYRIAPATIGGGVVDTPFATQPSYGVSVVPLRHVSAATMSQLVSGFVADGDGLRVDQSRNAMIVRGPGPRRQEAVQAIMSFDADWMQNQAVGIYEVRQATPEAVVAELNRVFDSEAKGGAGGVIQFKPIGRLRAVMVVTKNPTLMKRAESWVRRLDRDSASGAESVFVYKARYRDAKELARIVTSLFRAGGDGGRGGRSSTDQSLSGGASGSSGFASDSDSTTGGAGGSGSSSGSSSFNQSSTTGDSSQRQQNASQPASGQSAFNNPNFGDQAGAGAAGGSGDGAAAEGGGSIDLTTQAAGARSNILISADPANNAVVTYADGYTYQKVLAALRQLDSTPLQVAIHATIAEVQLTDDMRNGVEYFLRAGRLGGARDSGSFSLFGTAANQLSKQTPGFNLLVGTNSNPDVVISALDQVTNVEILSSPSLVVAENQKANFQVGDEIPIVTRQAQSVENVDSPLVNQVEFKNTGIILNVIPRIGQNDAVTMQIEQEISSVSSGGDTLTPTISKRRVASNISVVSGQTVLLAGLISKRNERSKNQIPILGDIKGLGNLFSVRGSAKDRTELVVMIRPVVIRSGEDAASVADEFRSRLKVLGGGARPAGFTK